MTASQTRAWAAVSLAATLAAFTCSVAFAVRSEFTMNYYVHAAPHQDRTRKDGEGVPDVPVRIFGACRIGGADADGKYLWRVAGPELPVNARTNTAVVTAREQAEAPVGWKVTYALPVNR